MTLGEMGDTKFGGVYLALQPAKSVTETKYGSVCRALSRSSLAMAATFQSPGLDPAAGATRARAAR